MRNRVAYIKLFPVTEFVTFCKRVVMYDTVGLRLNRYNVPGVSFMDEAPRNINITGEYEYRDSRHTIVGETGGLTIAINDMELRITRGSLCKWYLGDNIRELGREDVRRAIERLSDTLHLPMELAAVTRLDVAHNLFMRYPPEVYCNHLGGLRYATRLQEPEGVYYKQGSGRSLFYDKAREAGGDLPERYRGEHILRYERRFTKKLPHYLQEPEITAATLYRDAFCVKVAALWKKGYDDISKVNEITINPEAMKSKKEFERAARLALVEKFGGESALCSMIKEMYKQGDITKKQAYDMRKKIKDVCNSGLSLTARSEAVVEMDLKISEAAGRGI